MIYYCSKLKKWRFEDLLKSIRYTLEEFKTAVQKAKNFTEVVKNLSITASGASFKTIKKHIAYYNISIEHFTYDSQFVKEKTPLSKVLVENSSYGRANIKKRLLKDGLKNEQCEICSQPNEWNGKHLIMILDHINGVYNDNRLENLRMVCPNCNYQLETTAARKNKKPREVCPCGKNASSVKGKYCSRKCYVKFGDNYKPNPTKHKVEHPTYEELMRLVKEFPMTKIGEMFGVTDNSVRAWIKRYEKHINLQST
jgi:hypothetical protein